MKMTSTRAPRVLMGIAAATAFALLPVSFAAAGGASEGSPDTITVIGTGEVTAEPDQANVNVGVQLYSESAQEAAAMLRSRMDAVITAIRDLGIPPEQIQTTNYSIFFERDFQRPLAPDESGVERPVGAYRVENMVRVTISDVARAAGVVEAAIEAGANQLYGITFSFSEPEQLDAEARALAMEDATTRAGELAGAADRELGEAIRISEIVGGSPTPYEPRAMASGMGGGPVQPGASRYTTRVEVTYELR